MEPVYRLDFKARASSPIKTLDESTGKVISEGSALTKPNNKCSSS